MKKLWVISGGIFDQQKVEAKLKDLEKTLAQENFWKDKNLVKKTVKQKKKFEENLKSYQKSLSDINNLKDLYSLASYEKNSEIIDDCNTQINEIQKSIKDNEIKCFIWWKRWLRHLSRDTCGRWWNRKSRLGSDAQKNVCKVVW